jgi:hypothetical protein
MKQIAHLLQHFFALFSCPIDQCAMCGEHYSKTHMTLQDDAFRVCKSDACEEQYMRLTA